MITNRRTIKSFVLREGRLTKGQAHAISEHWTDFGLEYSESNLDFNSIFKRTAPVVFEIGFGSGSSLVSMATNDPESDFIGIEIHRPGIGTCIIGAMAANLKNLRIIRHDACEVLANQIADNSLDKVQIFFPDPWHKSRHNKRRIIQPAFVELVAKKLKPNGILHMATDWEAYSEHMLETVTANTTFKNLSLTGFIPRPETRPLTKFEQRGLNLGHKVWDLMFTKM